MKCFIALGSNWNGAQSKLEEAIGELKSHPACVFKRSSSYFQNPAMLPPSAPSEWNRAFYNAVCEVDWLGEDASELLRFLKEIEARLGRQDRQRWAPREIDLDLLSFGDHRISTEELKLPHPGIAKRSFVLDPLCELDCSYVFPGQSMTVLGQRRSLITRSPSFMSILNLTPDSFSSTSQERDLGYIESEILKAVQAKVAWLDLGAESTRPAAKALSLEEEWARLEPALEIIKSLRQSHSSFPKLSIDTYKPEIAHRAMAYGIDAINDVSGGKSQDMLNLVRQAKCDYICMHSLSVPARTDLLLPEDFDVVKELYEWAQKRLQQLEQKGIDLARVVLDPGIGFNKSPSQSLAIMQRIEEFQALPVRLLVGHSRKSFMKVFTEKEAPERDLESIGISMHLGLKGVEIIRAHQAHQHQRAWQACQHLHPQ